MKPVCLRGPPMLCAVAGVLRTLTAKRPAIATFISTASSKRVVRGTHDQHEHAIT
jgi:hypothetical protein